MIAKSGILAAALLAPAVALAAPAAEKTAVPPVEHKIVSPRDPQSGLPTGQRMHKPFRVESKDGKTAYEVTPDAAGKLTIKLASGADGPAARVPDGEILLKGDLKIKVKDGLVIEGGERIGIAPLPSP